ncbi:MAG: 4-hydroxy-tetrahydrodipicolinate synthase [Mogibacterium sp.]|nr:4-hydroxy-tetrahydrodipicolinate synthase [Mogibacterium sp.]
MAKTNTIFEGVATALITPMTENGVNYEQFGRLIDWQIDEGIDALVIAGTTGEGSTLTDEEHKECITFAVERVNHRIPVIAGTGSNHTEYGKQLTKFASDAGADACLIVTSYYNKATQKGLVKLFSEYASVSDVPIIAYNVPSRTGLNIEPSTYAELAKIDKVAAIKEANSNISKIVDTFAKVGDQMDIYSGNDDQIVPFLSMGGKGVISVLSNVIPKETKEICTKFWAGDIKGAAALQCKYNELVSALFCEVNPIPVKEALTLMGFCDPIIRSPLYRMEEDNLKRLTKAMQDLNII